jgi:hypothetical protein
MDLSGRYRAGWTFHRFLQGLQKFFGRRDREDHTADFQQLHGELREVSQRLNDPEIRPVTERLEEIRARVDRLLDALDQEDRQVDPSLVRLFLKRVKNYDERILLDLLRFLIEIQRNSPWENDRLDKVDFLVTRLAEVVSGEGLQGDRSRLSRILAGLSERAAPMIESGSTELADQRSAIELVRQEAEGVETLEELTEQDLVGRYRELKHRLGAALLERSILPLIVDTNIVLAIRIRDFASAEEHRILRDYDKLAMREGAESIDGELESSVSSLEVQISRFRQQLESGRVRLEDMVLLRESVSEILERSEAESPEMDASTGSEGEGRESAGGMSAPRDMPVIEESFQELVTALSEIAAGSEVSEVLADSECKFRFGSRELKAYQRLDEEMECDEALENFVLAAAALRLRMAWEVGMVEPSAGRAWAGAQRPAGDIGLVLDLGSLFLRRFEHEMESALLRGELDEARELQLLRIRLMREYSGLWLAGGV